jgi:acetyltransferase-like isoleucine patch superfamily enzyme
VGKGAVLCLKRIHTDGACARLPRVLPAAIESGRGRVQVGREGVVARGAELSALAGQITSGRRSSIRSYVKLMADDRAIRIGEQSQIIDFTIVYGRGGVTIGDRVLVSNHCLIASIDHTFPGRDSVALSPMREAPIVIGDDVWLGAFCVVLAGGTIGEGAIVGAYLLVREDVPPIVVIAGQPARVARLRS